MKKTLINYSKNGAFDEIYTPDYAVYPIIPFLPKDKIIWCPFDTEESNYVKVLRKFGFEVINSHIEDGKDFFNWQPEEWDIIVSNPPYSIKDRVLERCYVLGKPFALLLPITTLEGVKRGELFRRYGIQVLVLDRRINFFESTPNKEHKKDKSSCWFNSSYFCWKLLPKDLMFAKIDNKHSKQKSLI